MTGPSRPRLRLGRVLLKALVLFLLLNALFAALNPLDTLGRVSLYNALIPGRLRLPYGEVPQRANNLTLTNLPAMFASHLVAQPKAADEYRVILLGDSGIWGWLLDNPQTLAGRLNAAALRAPDGRRVVVYNLGYPSLSLTKDLLLLDRALATDPDLVVWPMTLRALAPDQQLATPLVQENPAALRRLIHTHDLGLNPADPGLADPTFWERTIVGRRRPLADLLRLQAYGVAWAATGIDQAPPLEVTPSQSDFEADLSWGNFTEPQPLTADFLALDVVAAGVAQADPVPVLVVNEPIYRSSGQNSDLRYNAWYPRWAYDQYRALLGQTAAAGSWRYVDVWDAIPATQFSDSPVHLTPAGTAALAERLIPHLRVAMEP